MRSQARTPIRICAIALANAGHHPRMNSPMMRRPTPDATPSRQGLAPHAGEHAWPGNLGSGTQRHCKRSAHSSSLRHDLFNYLFLNNFY